ncbi:glycosyltransferase [Paenibacillus wynnii]|uniref:Glycosyltransferase n=1 Tax=Paenibacillus wynnii TaxID=268407 RepID=A0A098MEM4_9BACL|nr:glycosyltransferase [Paenibacillus wynnii]KGE20488.1 glycosyltransferase [Paenibacillus wynnii]
MLEKACDVVIPVYNAALELEECINSLLLHTNLSNNRIIIINDCSPDPLVNKYLGTINQSEQIIILQNDENLGFVGTVNRGMSSSTNDIVLLNSDTIVTKNWLDKIIEVAYSDPSIATVTPLTNNGSICSIPHFLEDNPIPLGYTIDSFAEFIERTSLRKYFEIPTAVGFCMFIKRNVISEVGLFDQENFGKGYGEENDFCCRVIEHGYKNILDDHTFIFHKGSMSFQGEKLALLKKNLKTLNKKYPYYDRNIHEFITRNPLKVIHENINLRLNSYVDSHETKGNLLFVLHNFFDESYTQPIGGTEYHVKDIVEGLDDFFAYVLVTNGHEIVLKQYFKGKMLSKYNFPLEEPITLQHFHHREYSDIVEKIINSFEISIIHIHHLIRHTFDVPYIASKYGIKTIFSLHDYYLFCPRVNLLDVNNEYCKDVRSQDKCSSCLRETYGFHTTFINKWKEEVESMMSRVDLFVTPSEFTKTMFEEEFNSIKDKLIAIEHGILRVELNKVDHECNSKSWNIGFLGGLSPNKGSDLIYQLVTKFPKNKVNWHLIGGLGDQKLNLLNQNNVQKHGPYARENLSEIIKNINLDIICLLSPWPETYSYTLTEAWNHGIPVIVTPVGALKERVEKAGGGWVADSLSLEDVISKLNQVINNETEYLDIKNSIKRTRIKTQSEMIEQYHQLYEGYSSLQYERYNNGFDNHSLMGSLKYYHPISDSSESIGQYNNHIQSLEAELIAMKATIGWKVLTILRTRNRFALKLGKKGIYIILRLKNSMKKR